MWFEGIYSFLFLNINSIILETIINNLLSITSHNIIKTIYSNFEQSRVSEFSREFRHFQMKISLNKRKNFIIQITQQYEQIIQLKLYKIFNNSFFLLTLNIICSVISSEYVKLEYSLSISMFFEHINKNGPYSPKNLSLKHSIVFYKRSKEEKVKKKNCKSWCVCLSLIKEKLLSYILTFWAEIITALL